MFNKRPTANPITIQLPNGERVTSTHEAELTLPMLRFAARHVHLVPGLHNCSLLSIGQLCDAGYEVTFDYKHMHVILDGHCVLHGEHSTTTRLWHVQPYCEPIHNHIAAAAFDSPNSAKLVAFAHATLFSPALSTLEKALQNGHLINFPGLTLSTLRKHPPRSLATIKGHLDQDRKNKQSTRPSASPIPVKSHELAAIQENDTDMQPLGIETPTQLCYAATFMPTGQIYSDQTGCFILPSSTGNNYVMIL